MSPLKLSDDELNAILAAGDQIAVDRQSAFLERIAELLRGVEIGPGSVHRAIREAAREYFDAPELEETRGRWSKYA
jgi:hypothetical protein